jgi:protein-arginine kinase activator protein McsA
MTAQCYACHEELPVKAFARDETKASGRSSICKPCDREKSRRYYREHREEKLAKVKARAKTRPAPRYVAECRTCGGSFERSRKDRVFCSRRCKDRSRWAKWGP